MIRPPTPPADLDLTFKLRLVRCADDGFELTLSLPEINIEVEVAGNELSTLIVMGATAITGELNERGYGVTRDDVLATIQASVEQYAKQRSALN